MTCRPILSIPDPRLRRVCSPVENFDNKLKILSDDMIETMYAAPGIGLAAPQIGILKRLLVMDCGSDKSSRSPKVLVNPKIIWHSEEERSHEEGCLSIPETYAEIHRSKKVKVAYKTVSGEECEDIFSDLWSTCVQHEIDHLDGRLFIDYLGSVKRTLIMNKMKKLKREHNRTIKFTKIKDSKN